MEGRKCLKMNAANMSWTGNWTLDFAWLGELLALLIQNLPFCECSLRPAPLPEDPRTCAPQDSAGGESLASSGN